jgi:hypothetical protein
MTKAVANGWQPGDAVKWASISLPASMTHMQINAGALFRRVSVQPAAPESILKANKKGYAYLHSLENPDLQNTLRGEMKSGFNSIYRRAGPESRSSLAIIHCRFRRSCHHDGRAPTLTKSDRRQRIIRCQLPLYSVRSRLVI